MLSVIAKIEFHIGIKNKNEEPLCTDREKKYLKILWQ